MRGEVASSSPSRRRPQCLTEMTVGDSFSLSGATRMASPAPVGVGVGVGVGVVGGDSVGVAAHSRARLGLGMTSFRHFDEGAKTPW